MQKHIYFDSDEGALYLLDQTLLPAQEEFVSCKTYHEAVEAIKTMVVRGAPAIGVTAAWACLLALMEYVDKNDWTQLLEKALDEIENARPTAVNARWAVEHMRQTWHSTGSLDPDILVRVWRSEAATLQRSDVASCKEMGRHGAELVQDGWTIMTHCNAGALATAGYGTALGVIRAAFEAGKNIKVIANETRPLLQGARLTAYELHSDGIPVTVACDNACASLMRRGMVQMVVVGADRIAANGDTANKIGTYGVAALSRGHGIPFYVAAPLSTFDINAKTGDDIPIESRSADEVAFIGEKRIMPEGVSAFNFAFDVTPAPFISGIITEKGVLYPPYIDSIAKAMAR